MSDEPVSRFDLAAAYVQSQLTVPMERCPPVRLSGFEVLEALWPLNDRFRPLHHRIKTLDYDAAFEGEADRAIEALTQVPADDWSSVSPGAWRVLLERFLQAQTSAMANELAGNPVMSLPSGLPEHARLPALALLLLHSMPLPFPVASRAEDSPPGVLRPASLRPS